MKIALAQQNYHIGNFEYNTNKIIEAVKQAKKQGADLVVFSELCICGYPPRDFLEFKDFIDECDRSIKRGLLEPETALEKCLLGLNEIKAQRKA